MRGTRRRVDRLAARVGWLDPRRRRIAVATAALGAPALSLQALDHLGADWPFGHAIGLMTLVGGVLWIAMEVVLAWLVALWETEHSRLLREDALPGARLHRDRSDRGARAAHADRRKKGRRPRGAAVRAGSASDP